MKREFQTAPIVSAQRAPSKPRRPPPPHREFQGAKKKARFQTPPAPPPPARPQHPPPLPPANNDEGPPVWRPFEDLNAGGATKRRRAASGPQRGSGAS